MLPARDALNKQARAVGSWMTSLDEGLRRRPLAQWRREQGLTETPDRSMRREQELAETPTRSTAPSTGAVGAGGRPTSGESPIPAPALADKRGRESLPRPVPLLQDKNLCARISSRCSGIPKSRPLPHSSFRDGYATVARCIRDGYATPPRRLRDAPATDTRRLRDGAVPAPLKFRSTIEANIQSKAEPSPGNWRALES